MRKLSFFILGQEKLCRWMYLPPCQYREASFLTPNQYCWSSPILIPQLLPYILITFRHIPSLLIFLLTLPPFPPSPPLLGWLVLVINKT